MVRYISFYVYAYDISRWVYDIYTSISGVFMIYIYLYYWCVYDIYLY